MPACAAARVHFESTDHYVVGAEPRRQRPRELRRDAAGGRRCSTRASPTSRLYATAGRGFETPTLNELAYRPDGETGLNFDAAARAQRQRRARRQGAAGAAANVRQRCSTSTRSDEIVTLSNVGGRSTYQNVGRDAAQGRRARLAARDARTLAHASRPTPGSTRATATPSSPAPRRRARRRTCRSRPATASPGSRATCSTRRSTGRRRRAGARASRCARSAASRSTTRNTDAAPGYIVASLHRRLHRWQSARWELQRLRARRQPHRQALHRLGDRQRGQRPLLRAGPGRNWTFGMSGGVSFLNSGCEECPWNSRIDAMRAACSPRRCDAWRGRPDVLVLALPRGGVPVAWEVAQALGAPLDVLVVRKLGFPGQEEFAMGAIASGGVRVMGEMDGGWPVSARALEAVVAREQAELAAARAALSRRTPAARSGRACADPGRRWPGDRCHHARGRAGGPGGPARSASSWRYRWRRRRRSRAWARWPTRWCAFSRPSTFARWASGIRISRRPSDEEVGRLLAGGP